MEIQQRRDGIRLTRTELAERELKLRHERRELKESIHEIELRSREIRQQIDHLIERIQDEYQIALHLSVASGESALFPRIDEDAENFPSIADDNGESVHGNRNERLPEDAIENELDDELPPPDLVVRRQEIEDRIEKLRRKVKQIGNVKLKGS